MNLRRINATERKETYSKLFLLIFLGLIVIIGTLEGSKILGDQSPEIPLSNYTCQEVYNLTMHSKLYSNTHMKTYQQDQVILYYMEHCK